MTSVCDPITCSGSLSVTPKHTWLLMTLTHFHDICHGTDTFVTSACDTITCSWPQWPHQMFRTFVYDTVTCMTSVWHVHDLCVTCSWPLCGKFVTPVTYSRPLCDIFMTSVWHVHDLCVASSWPLWHVHDLCLTCSWPLCVSEHYQDLDAASAQLMTRVGAATIHFTTVGVYTYKVSDVSDSFNSCSVIVNPGSKVKDQLSGFSAGTHRVGGAWWFHVSCTGLCESKVLARKEGRNLGFFHTWSTMTVMLEWILARSHLVFTFTSSQPWWSY